MDSWKYFEKVAQAKLESGKKRFIPIVGSGFNLQASGDGKNWTSLLNDIGLALGLSSKHLGIINLSQMSATSTWEHFITKVAYKKNKSASVIESELKKIVKKELVQFEKNHIKLKFYRNFLDLGFRDIVSLNFDRTLALQRRSKLIRATYVGNSSHFKNYRRHSITLFRHVEVTNTNKTRIWYPHGDTRLADSIKLGIREYGIYIKSIEESISAYMIAWMTFLDNNNFNFFKTPKLFNIEKYQHYWKLWCKELREHDELNWVWLLISAPIIFLGCGLSRDEWPMWWTLHQRARIFARLPEEYKEGCFLLWNVKNNSSTGMTEWLNERPANVILLPCEDWDKGWKRVIDAFK